ncbi:MAG TPA: DoxX family protein [Gemmatimonadales bacterium]|nr:DoxX family protein [Gemmatimonadales bacterium]
MLLPVQAATPPSQGLIAIFVIGRILFAWIFIMSGIAHLTQAQAMSQYAAMFKVPQPKLAVIVSGFMVLAGGLSILLGVYVEAGTTLLVLFLIPVAVYMHPFWGVSDPMQVAAQRAHFMKNMSLAGAALLICYFSKMAPDAWVLAVRR